MNKTALIAIVLFCALLGALGQLMFKLSSKTISLSPSSWLTNWKLLVGLILYGLATALFVYALKFGNLSILYPIIATSYVWVAIFARVFLQEPFPASKWLGIALIISGVWMISL